MLDCDVIIVAYSGGADSSLLLRLLSDLAKKEGISLCAAHVNHMIRGEAADEDMRFCEKECKRLGVKLHTKAVDVPALAKKRGVGLEECARDVRYAFFEELRTTMGAQAIAVAHHRDDNNETLLLNLVRGTGLRGLTGMKWKNGHIVRPLLGVSRQEIVDFLKEKEQPYVTDSTNAETLYKRNKIRHELLPLLRELNPAVDEALATTIAHLAEAELLYDEHLKACYDDGLLLSTPEGICIDLNKLKSCTALSTLLHEALKDYGFNPATVADILAHLDAQSGTLFESADHLAVIHQGRLHVERRPEAFPETELPLSGEVQLPNGRRLCVRRCLRSELTEIPRSANTACLDADKLCGGLSCRRVTEGDRFKPFGMKGSKLVSDYLTDRKRSRLEKMKALAVCDEQGIVWLVNERPSVDHAVTPETQHVLLLEWEE
jgi:tRNA(Ile)-lysidine synthase